MAKCVFCGDEAIGRFYLDEGCIARPYREEQDLCWHHARRSQPIGSFELLIDYTLPPGPRVADLLK